MEKKAKRYLGVLLFALMALTAVLWIRPVSAQAASTARIVNLDGTEEERTAGNALYTLKGNASHQTLWRSVNGKLTKLSPAISCEYIAVNETNVYYCRKDGRNVYGYSISTGKSTKVASLRSKSSGTMEVMVGFYKNKLYYIDSKGCFRSVDVSTGKVKQEAKGTFVKSASVLGEQGGKYIDLYTYSSKTLKLYIYNAATGKLKNVTTICSKDSNARHFKITAADSKYLYFVEASKKDSKYYEVIVYRCKADGTGKKAMTKTLSLKSYAGLKLTCSSVTYRDYNNKNKRTTVEW